MSFAQTPFVVKYDFDTNVSGSLIQGNGITMNDAVSGGRRLFNAMIAHNGEKNVWTAQVVNNNATNFTDTFIRFDIYPPAGSGILVSDITVKQTSDSEAVNSFFRIGCTLNGATPVIASTATEQATANILFTPNVYTTHSFAPGNSVNYAVGTDYISVFVCARSNTNHTMKWDIDDIEIKGSIIDGEASSLVINSAKHQLIEMMGGDMERSSDFIQKASNTNEILDWFIKDIDFNYFRVRYDKNQELNEGVKNWNFYANQVLTMKRIREINPDIKFLATMRSDYNGYNMGNHNNLPEFIYNYACTGKDANGKCISSTGDLSFYSDKYGVFLADYIEFMYNQGVPIDYLATAKEWQIVTAQRSHEAYLKMKAELETRGIPVPKIIGPASWGINTGVNYVNSVKNNNYTDEYFGFSTHDLGGTPNLWGSFVAASHSAGKLAFNDESAYSPGGRTSGAEPTDLQGLINAYSDKYHMYEGGISGELFFEIWSRGIDSETRGVYFRNGQAGTRMRSYYVMKDFANSAVNKYYCKSNLMFSSNVKALVFRDDLTVSVWLINDNDTAYNNMELQMPDETIYGNVRQHYWDNPTQKEAFVNSIANPDTGSSSVKVNLSPKSINYFKFAIDPAANLGTTQQNKRNLHLYPNPAKNYIKIEGSIPFNSPYKIVNSLGQEIQKGSLTNGERVDTTTLSTGMYFISLDQQKFKFFKE
ncbi:hypothetical protein FUMI01_24330 [Flavobacterium sp. UMI-01]|nr:hypothetical protein FUMI01_24330 [Flavobacterium sp. UMI-01]